MSDLGEILTVVRRLIDESHTTYVQLQHAAGLFEEIPNAAMVVRATVTDIFHNINACLDQLKEQRSALAAVATEGQLAVAGEMLQLADDAAAQATGALLALSATITQIFEQATVAVERVHEAAESAQAGNELMREWYPFDDIGM